MQNVRRIADRLWHYYKQRGAVSTLLYFSGKLLRYYSTCVYEADLRQTHPQVGWANGEHLLVIGPENSDPILNERIQAFLGGAAYECMEGLRSGDRLFVIANCDRYLHRGYISFTNRSNKLLCEDRDTPVIGYCYTEPSARGRGLYQRALSAEMLYLQQRGYRRVVIDTHPTNRASRNAIERTGFHLLRTVEAWIVLNVFAIRRIHTVDKPPDDKARWRVLFL